jgi:transposase-like protein
VPRSKKNFSPEHRGEAVKMVLETSRPVAQVARELPENKTIVDESSTRTALAELTHDRLTTTPPHEHRSPARHPTGGASSHRKHPHHQ